MLNSKKRWSDIHLSVRLFMLGWMFLNILAMPLAFAQEEPLISLETESVSIAEIGEWGKVTASGISQESIIFSPETQKQSLSLQTNTNPLLLLLTIAAGMGLFFLPKLDRRSQITIFILLGLTMLIAFFFIFFGARLERTADLLFAGVVFHGGGLFWSLCFLLCLPF